jgi:hypothetical protein
MKQIITYTYSFAVKQVSHQDFNTSLLHYKFRLIFMKAKKKKKKIEKKKIKMADAFFNFPNFKFFFAKISGIGPTAMGHGLVQ